MKFFLDKFTGKDDLELWNNALKVLKENPGSTLVVNPRVYKISTPLALKVMEDVFEGKYGWTSQEVLFNRNFKYAKGISIDGHKGTRIEAFGAILEIDGFMEPLSISHSSDIEVSGLTIRHKRKPYSKGVLSNRKVLEDGSIEFTIKMSKETPLKEGTSLFLRYSMFRKGVDAPIIARFEKAKFLDTYSCRGVVKSDVLKDGDEIYMSHTFHSRPAILLEHSLNITLKDITINNQPGMGIVGNRCENVILERLKVVPVEGDRFSTNTDATHFTSMKGDLSFIDCVFDGNGDDFINIHNYYQEVIDQKGPTEIYIQEKTPDGTHTQTLDYPDVGDELELTDFDTLQVLDTYKVVDVQTFPDEWMCKVILNNPLLKKDGVVLADITRLPNLLVKGCKATNHFARGILVKCRKGLIENNFFKNLRGPAIELAGEAWWYEGVCPSNIVIRNNKIVNCGMEFGEAGILVKADSKKANGQSIFNIEISDNDINQQTKHGIIVQNTDGLLLSGNSIICSEDPIELIDTINVKYRN